MLKPVGHHVLILVDSTEKVSAGGIILKDSTVNSMTTQADTGVVIEIGPTAYADMIGEPWCKVGDRVCFVKYSGIEKKIEDKTYRLVNDQDIKAIET